MKFGMNMLLWTTEVTEAHFPLFNELKGIGFDGVELPVFEMNESKFRATGKALDSAGLARTAVTVCTPEANPVGESPAIRQAAVDHLKKAIDVCHAAGVTALCGPIHSALGVFTGQGRTTDEWNRAKDVLRQAAEHAQKAGITLVVEYLNRFECYFLNCAADATQFVNEVNHPALRTMYDSFHANIEEKCIATAVKTIAPVLAHVHISENDRSTPGQGGVNWDATFNALREIRYDGWLMVEAFGLALPALAAATKIWRRMFQDELTLCRDALAFMKSRTNW